MSTAEMVMDERIVWDSMRLKEVDEAKSRIMQLKRQGHPVFLADGITPMERFSSQLEEVVVKAKKLTKSILKILSEEGDTRLTWDRENGNEALEAKKKFTDLLKQGYTAYSVDVNGKKNRKIEEFDVDAEEILMVPKTVKG